MNTFRTVVSSYLTFIFTFAIRLWFLSTVNRKVIDTRIDLLWCPTLCLTTTYLTDNRIVFSTLTTECSNIKVYITKVFGFLTLIIQLRFH